MKAVYEGWPGSGLRLEAEDDPCHCVDVGGSHGKGGMTLYVSDGDNGAQVELDPLDVARLTNMCAQWLAWHHAGRPSRDRRR